MTDYILAPAIAASCIAVACAAITARRRARFLIPLSGVLLAGIAVFGLIPEIAHELGWIASLALAAVGYCALTLLEYAGLPVCAHDGEFAASLVAATAVHAFIDGWTMVATAHHGAVSAAIVTAMLIHKIPEGLALGAMLPGRSAILLAMVAEMPTILGGATGIWATPVGWVNYPLAVAAGTFLFLGIHAIIPKR